MKSVTDSIMRHTDNMQSLDINDYYVMDLAERQMLSQATSKKEWTGWKVKNRLPGGNASWHEVQCRAVVLHQ